MSVELSIKTKQGSVFGMAAGASESPLVLCIHGWSKRNGWHSWAPLLDPLGSAGFFVVSIDMPGWGQSPSWKSGQMTQSAYIDAVWEIMQGLDKDKASLMGKSWGGGIAIELALRNPRVVDKLILSAPAFPDKHRLSELTKPVLLTWAEDDPVISYTNVQTFKESINQIEFIGFESGGHSAAANNADEFGKAVVDFLHRN